MKLADLNTAKLRHGTRGRYVAGCRCDVCRGANRTAARERVQAVRAAAAEVQPNPVDAAPKIFQRTRRDGTRYEVRGRACPGTGGRPCVAGGAWLRAGLAVCVACIDRARVWNGLVPAARARRHLRKLSRAGIGYKAVSEACDVAASTLAAVLTGGKRQIRTDVERRILAVDAGARADGALVPSGPTWALLDDLAARGFTRRWMSAELGYSWYASIFAHRGGCRRPFVTARNAKDVERLHRRIVDQRIAPPSPFEDAEPIYRILGELLARVPRKPLSKMLGYAIQRRPPRRVTRRIAERVRAFAAELERRRREGDPLPDAWQAGGSPIAAAFGYEGGWQWERRTSKRARAQEELELRSLAKSQKRTG